MKRKAPGMNEDWEQVSVGVWTQEELYCIDVPKEHKGTENKQTEEEQTYQQNIKSMKK